MDSIHTLVNEAQVRHYIKWPTLGVVSTGAPEVEPQPVTYNAAVFQMKKWITTRLTWLDKNMPGRVIPIDNTPVFSMKSSAGRSRRLPPARASAKRPSPFA